MMWVTPLLVVDILLVEAGIVVTFPRLGAVSEFEDKACVDRLILYSSKPHGTSPVVRTRKPQAPGLLPSPSKLCHLACAI
jgi:hypothetical protein